MATSTSLEPRLPLTSTVRPNSVMTRVTVSCQTGQSPFRVTVYFVRLRTIGAHVGRLRCAPIALPSSSPVTLKGLFFVLEGGEGVVASGEQAGEPAVGAALVGLGIPLVDAGGRDAGAIVLPQDAGGAGLRMRAAPVPQRAVAVAMRQR